MVSKRAGELGRKELGFSAHRKETTFVFPLQLLSSMTEKDLLKISTVIMDCLFLIVVL